MDAWMKSIPRKKVLAARAIGVVGRLPSAVCRLPSFVFCLCLWPCGFLACRLCRLCRLCRRQSGCARPVTKPTQSTEIDRSLYSNKKPKLQCKVPQVFTPPSCFVLSAIDLFHLWDAYKTTAFGRRVQRLKYFGATGLELRWASEYANGWPCFFTSFCHQI